MRNFLLSAAALAVLALVTVPPSPAAAADNEHGFVYLGHVADDGHVTGAFDGVPVLKVSNERTSDVEIAGAPTIVANQGVTVRAEHAPSAAAIGRLPKGGKLKLLRVHAAFGYVWGAVDVASAHLLR